MSTESMLCFNRGCGETFNPSTNVEGNVSENEIFVAIQNRTHVDITSLY